MDINLDLTSFSRAMDCDLRQQGGDKKHKNREDFSQNVGLHVTHNSALYTAICVDVS